MNACGIFAPQEHALRGFGLMLAYLGAAGLGKLADRIRDADPDPDSLCSCAASLGDRRVGPSDRVRIGDACASIPPFTGNGLAMALESAEMAAEPLQAYAASEASWQEARGAIAAAQCARFGRRLMIAGLIHPFFLGRVRQSILAAIVGSRLVPFGALYAALR